MPRTSISQPWNCSATPPSRSGQTSAAPTGGMSAEPRRQRGDPTFQSAENADVVRRHTTASVVFGTAHQLALDRDTLRLENQGICRRDSRVEDLECPGERSETNHPPHHQKDSAAQLAWPAARSRRAFAAVLLGNRRRFLLRYHYHRNDDKECEPAGRIQGCLQRECRPGVPLDIGIAHGVQVAK